MVAAFEGQGNTVAQRPQQIRRPRPQCDHDMARGNRAVRQRHAPAVAVRRDSLDVRLTDVAAGACEHPRIGLDHRARRVDGGGLGVEQADLVDRQNIRLERGNVLAVEQPALDAIFGQKGLLGLRRRDGIAAPCLQPAGLADALRRIRLDDPFPMQLQRGADQAVQRRCPRPEARRRRIGQEADHPIRVPNRPRWIPAQRGVPVGQIFRQCVPQRRIVEWRDRAAGENTGIAIGGLAAGLTPVGEDHRQPPLPRRIGRGHADDAGTEHDHIHLLV